MWSEWQSTLDNEIRDTMVNWRIGSHQWCVKIIQTAQRQVTMISLVPAKTQYFDSVNLEIVTFVL